MGHDYNQTTLCEILKERLYSLHTVFCLDGQSAVYKPVEELKEMFGMRSVYKNEWYSLCEVVSGM